MSLSETISSIVQTVQSLPTAMESAMPSGLALANASNVMDQAVVQRSWFGTLGHMMLFLIRIVPGVLYWLVTFTTITMPTFLFTLFSTSLTFTMNATTL